MRRYYYLCDDLDELDRVEQELEQDGFSHRSIQILSEDDAGVNTHPHLHKMPSLLRFDTAWYLGGGLLVGLILALGLLLISWLAGLTAQIGVGPVLMMAALLMMFCGWEGGFLGFQRFNHKLRRFLPDLRRGRHLLLVDIPDHRIRRLQQHLLAHPQLYPAGFDERFLNPFILNEGQQL